MTRDQLIAEIVDEAFEFLNENPKPTEIRDWLRSSLLRMSDASLNAVEVEREVLLKLTREKGCSAELEEILEARLGEKRLKWEDTSNL